MPNDQRSDTDQEAKAGGSLPLLRTVVFVDAQNMYRGAREAFGWTNEAGQFGNFKMLAFGKRLADGPNRTLEEVRVYTGIPTPRRNPRGNAATQRRIAAWIADDPARVQVFPSPLRYPPIQGREKGVDVELAIDMVDLATNNSCDILILASADTDLIPALKFIVDRCPEIIVETVAWAPLQGHEHNTAAPIDISGGGVHRRTLNKNDFDVIADKRNFLRNNTRPEAVVGRQRWSRIRRRM